MNLVNSFIFWIDKTILNWSLSEGKSCVIYVQMYWCYAFEIKYTRCQESVSIHLSISLTHIVLSRAMFSTNTCPLSDMQQLTNEFYQKLIPGTKRRLIEFSFWIQFKSEINTRGVLNNQKGLLHVTFRRGSNTGSANRSFTLLEEQVIYLYYHWWSLWWDHYGK